MLVTAAMLREAQEKALETKQSLLDTSVKSKIEDISKSLMEKMVKTPTIREFVYCMPSSSDLVLVDAIINRLREPSLGYNAKQHHGQGKHCDCGAEEFHRRHKNNVPTTCQCGASGWIEDCKGNYCGYKEIVHNDWCDIHGLFNGIHISW